MEDEYMKSNEMLMNKRNWILTQIRPFKLSRKEILNELMQKYCKTFPGMTVGNMKPKSSLNATHQMKVSIEKINL